MTSLNLTTEILHILKNFSDIQSNLVIECGNDIRTISTAQDIFASLEIEENGKDLFFSKEIRLYDTKEFLSVCSLIPDGTFSLEGETIIISNESNRFSYRMSPKDLLFYPENSPLLPPEEYRFVLTKDMIGQLKRAANILAEAKVVITNGKISLQSSAEGNSFEMNVEMNVSTEREIHDVFDISMLKVFPMDYIVRAHDNVLLSFYHSWHSMQLDRDMKLTYAITLEETA